MLCIKLSLRSALQLLLSCKYCMFRHYLCSFALQEPSKATDGYRPELACIVYSSSFACGFSPLQVANACNSNSIGCRARCLLHQCRYADTLEVCPKRTKSVKQVTPDTT